MNNRIIWIFVFVILGFFLYNKDKGGLLGLGWKKTKEIILADNKTKNPYKAPEPSENVASADNSASKNEESASAETDDLWQKVKEKIKEGVIETVERPENDKNNDLPDFALPAIKSSDEIIKHKGYTLKYVEKHEQAAWVVHRLRGDYTRGVANRKGTEFIPDSQVSGRSALPSDYSRSGYDRGHLVPAGDFKCCQDLMNETFKTSNISPQIPDFNRGIWENIEERIRAFARNDDEIYIVTGPVLKDGLPTIGRYNYVSIPEKFYKIALFMGDKPRAIAFLLPNEALFGKRMTQYVVSVDEVERVTGIDFFAKLPDATEKRIEAESDWDEWTKY